MTYSPEQATLLAAFAATIGTVITAYLTYRYNLFKASNEQSLKVNEAEDKNRTSSISSFRNELGLNPGLVKEILGFLA